MSTSNDEQFSTTPFAPDTRRKKAILRGAHVEVFGGAAPTFFSPSLEGFGLSNSPEPSRRASGAPAIVWIAQFPANIPVNPFVVPPTITREIRRLRQAPHLSDEDVRQFFVAIQVDLEAGVGLPIGQGEDPQVMLRWSDDGAHQWSNEHWVTAGRVGKYTWRAMFRRLGYSRDRVFQVVVSDPVKWRLLDVILHMKPGLGT